MEIVAVGDPARCSQYCELLIDQLPHWFGRPKSNAAYIAGVADPEKICFDALGDDGDLMGFLSLRLPFPNNADVYWLGVVPHRHREGIGRCLMEAAINCASARNCQTLTVETLGPSDPDEGYAETRAFYRAMGFRPLFELKPYDEATPMIYMIRALAVLT